MSKGTQNPVQQYDDEISLYELYRILVERKIILVATIMATLVAAIIYLAITTPVFEANVRLYAPKTNPLTLSVPDHSATEFDAVEVFQEFQAYIKSMEQWRRFVAANSNLFSQDARERRIAKLGEHPIKTSKDKDFLTEHIDIAYQYEDGAGSATILGNYLNFVRDNYISDAINLAKDRIERQRENITAEIVALRQKAYLMRQDEIDRLRQDLSLANKLGITENMLMRSENAAHSGGDITVIAANENIRGYLRGTRSLEAELESLLKRESDDPYVIGLREKQIGLEQLKELQITTSRFSPYAQDGDIDTPTNPIKPNKGKVLVLSVILGGVLGVLLVFLVNSIQKIRADQ